MVKVLDRDLFSQAKRYISGGVNSPVRSFQSVGGYPVFIKRGSGSKIFSEDKREFIDYCMSWGAQILGHAHPRLTRALNKALSLGTSFGAPTKLETELARLIREAVPSIKRIRFTSSGTEAVMSAVRLSRAYTGRNKLIKFAGSYHGHADYLLDCPGVPVDFKKHTLTLPYNDIGKTEAAVKKYQKDIAAIIVEPVAGNMGVVLPRPGFLEGLRRISDKYGIVLIFDEVITGFRVSYGGAQSRFKVKPDLTCLGKIIGGGLPCGAYGGKDQIMKLVSPEGKVYQAGTLSGNPIAVTAGITTLRILKEERPYAGLQERAERLADQIRLIAARYKVRLKVNQISSMFSLFFTDKDVVDYAGSRSQNSQAFNAFFHRLLKEGVYLSPSGYEANFLSCAHLDKDIKQTLWSIDKALENLRRG